MITKIGKVEILSVDIILDGVRNLNEDYDFGALTLKLEGREYILDTVQTFWTEQEDTVKIQCEVEKDEDTFTTCLYNITEMDVMSDNLLAEFYVGGDFTNHIESITLFVKDGSLTKAIDVQAD